jgi:hypothetical protein
LYFGAAEELSRAIEEIQLQTVCISKMKRGIDEFGR